MFAGTVATPLLNGASFNTLNVPPLILIGSGCDEKFRNLPDGAFTFTVPASRIKNPLVEFSRVAVRVVSICPVPLTMIAPGYDVFPLIILPLA